jgi:CRISPR-associated protein Csd1
VRGGNTQGGALISFNLPAFNSYGKTQNFNAPVGKRAAFAYATALNVLLGKDSANKITIADSTIVFWSEKKSEGIDPEEIFPWVIAMQKTDRDNPDRGVEKIEKLFDSIFTGKYSQAKTNHFFVLGLSPNAARISVRFWKAPSVEDFGKNIRKHFDDFAIISGPKDSKYLSLYQILSATALQYKMENVPPNLTGAVIESIIDGTPYPTSLLQQCIRRIRAEQNVNRTRAAILKAYLNRFNKIHKPNEKEITMSLDPNNTNVAYRTGRLFAVLEKIQEEANPGINTTIRDRFYGAASSSPVTVFPRLLSLKNSHLKKLNDGKKIYFEKLIGEILSELKSFPTNLSLNEQANFAIGYYHQRQNFFTKKSNKEETELINN